MNFRKRLTYYLIGFGIGIIMVYFLFKGRGMEWTPNNRVLNTISSCKILISDKIKCLINCNEIQIENIFNLLENGDVNFSESQTKKRIKNYIIEHDKLKVNFSLNKVDSIAELININTSSNCNCMDSSNSNLQPLYMPNKMVLSKLKAKKIKRSKLFNCQFDCLNLINDDINYLLNKGEVLFEKSKPQKKPNPIFLILMKKNDTSFLFLIEEGATKTRFKQVLHLNNDLLSDFSINKIIERKPTQQCLCK